MTGMMYKCAECEVADIEAGSCRAVKCYLCKDGFITTISAPPDQEKTVSICPHCHGSGWGFLHNGKRPSILDKNKEIRK